MCICMMNYLPSHKPINRDPWISALLDLNLDTFCFFCHLCIRADKVRTICREGKGKEQIITTQREIRFGCTVERDLLGGHVAKPLS